MVTAYYNDNDRGACEWLRELIKTGLIPDGDVDERSIWDVEPSELKGYTQCHFFAGIGGWAYALQLAGWPEDREVWTGSCPCQPFSCAGKGLAERDERHLWPAFRRLISECGPATAFGEQVASAAGRVWLAGVRADLEAMDYEVGASDICAAGVGAPHIRQRLFWVGHAESRNGEVLLQQRRPQQASAESRGAGRSSGLADATEARREGAENAGADCDDAGEGPRCLQSERSGQASGLGDSGGPGLERQPRHGDGEREPGRLKTDTARPATEAGDVPNFWSNSTLIPCGDGKARRVEPSIQPLAHGVPGRVGLLRGAGNAISPQVAQAFIEAFVESEP